MMLSTYAVAAIGAYLYARRAGADIAGSVATSLIWQWSAFMVEQIGHTNIVHTAAVLPWLLWAVDGYLATGRRRRGLLIVALLALQIFAGQQTFAYSLLLVMAYALGDRATLPEARKRLGAVAIFIVQDWRWQRCRSYRRSSCCATASERQLLTNSLARSQCRRDSS